MPNIYMNGSVPSGRNPPPNKRKRSNERPHADSVVPSRCQLRNLSTARAIPVHLHVGRCYRYLGREEKYSADEKDPDDGHDVDGFSPFAQGERPLDKVNPGLVQLVREDDGYVREVERWRRDAEYRSGRFDRSNGDAV